MSPSSHEDDGTGTIRGSPSTPTGATTTSTAHPTSSSSSSSSITTPTNRDETAHNSSSSSSSTMTTTQSPELPSMHSRQSSTGGSSVIYHPSSRVSTPLAAATQDTSSAYNSPSNPSRPTGILLPSSSSSTATIGTLTPAPNSSRMASTSAAGPSSGGTRRLASQAPPANRETLMATDTDLKSLQTRIEGQTSEEDEDGAEEEGSESYFNQTRPSRMTSTSLQTPLSYASITAGTSTSLNQVGRNPTRLPTPLTGGVGGRTPSTHPGLNSSRRNTANNRSVSRARIANSDSEDGERPGRAMSPLPGRDRSDMLGMGLASNEDDEVSVRDRGEELVRKRMKERSRVKKEAEKAATRKREAERAAAIRRASSYYNDPENVETQAIGMGPPPISTDAQYYQQRSQSRAGLRDPSTSASAGGGAALDRRISLATTATTVDDRSDVGRAGGITPTREGETWSPMFPGRTMLQRGKSYSSSRGGGGGGTGADVFSDRAEELANEESLVGAEEEIDPFDENQPGANDVGSEATDDDDEDIDDADVEYTLKDRQDAINVEHPFGLPIWKPALYKKDRSITRNAEKALHDTPSSTAVRHLAPGNLLWTLFFGAALFLICTIIAAFLSIVPWGGRKYGRVVWELGGYLFWPFGKYVEGWTDEFDDEEEDHSESNGGHDVIEEHPDEEEEADRASLRRDLEAAGSTYGRSRGRGDRSTSTYSQRRSTSNYSQRRSEAGDVSETHLTVRGMPSQSSLRVPSSSERQGLLSSPQGQHYGTAPNHHEDKLHRSSSDETVGATHSWRPHDFTKDDPDHAHHALRLRALGRSMFWVTFYLIVAPLMLFVCILCWGMVFTIPMAKLLWVLLRHLNNEPLSLHFRSPPKYSAVAAAAPTTAEINATVGSNSTPLGQHASSGVPLVGDGFQYPLVAGQRAPPVSRKSVAAAKRHGRLLSPHSTVLLCTYHAMGAQYYKYTIDGVNILFINLMSLVFFVILDFFYLAPRVEKHHLGGVLAFITSQACIFVLALLSVIPLSYFIGMAVASISAQSSIGMGAVINASFGSIIEIILYSIALTQKKGELVEGSIVGSILAGVLLMPGASMIGGAMRRKEQKFNARSAGVTSTMLIMAIIGILTPTLFYEIYGSFQLTCTDCDPDRTGTSESCRTCYYEHINPADDPFYKSTVKALSYYCAVLLVLSYLIGLWFSLRTHASQIWQNAQPKHDAQHHQQHIARPSSVSAPHFVTGPSTGADRSSLYKRLVPSQLLPRHQVLGSGGREEQHPSDTTPTITGANPDAGAPPPMILPEGLTNEEFERAYAVVATAAPSALRSSHAPTSLGTGERAALNRSSSHAREVSGANTVKVADHDAAGGGEGGHDAPNWSRLKSASVLMGCTVLYAVIAEILVDVVDVVLDGSGIPEKFLGVTLFALVPNTTEFMNAISFAINGNIALSMEIGSAYALQVCLIQAPAMLAFSAFYGIGKDTLLHRSFTLVFPRWDVIAIMFSVFLLTYTYIEARANYYRGSILCLSYLVLIGGFAFAPAGRDTSDNPGLWSLSRFPSSSDLSIPQRFFAILMSLFTR